MISSVKYKRTSMLCTYLFINFMRVGYLVRVHASKLELSKEISNKITVWIFLNHTNKKQKMNSKKVFSAKERNACKQLLKGQEENKISLISLFTDLKKVLLPLLLLRMN